MDLDVGEIGSIFCADKHPLPMIRIQVGLLPVFSHKFLTELWPLIDVFAAWKALPRGYSQILWQFYHSSTLLVGLYWIWVVHHYICPRAQLPVRHLCFNTNQYNFTKYFIWAAEWDFQQFDILTSVDSDEPLQPPFKLRNSKWRSVSSLIIIEYSSDLQRFWSDCAYAQAGLSLCWSHIPHCWESHVTAQIFHMIDTDKI